MACCTGHRENKFFEKISLAHKLCEMYAIINYLTLTLIIKTVACPAILHNASKIKKMTTNKCYPHD